MSYCFVLLILPILVVSRCLNAETFELKPNLKTLRVIQVIFRHGLRSIDITYPTDPYIDESHWDPGYSQLNNEGKLQAFELGTFLRKRYEGFIQDTYNFKDIYVLSSDYPRTIQTAYAVLAGLYLPNDLKMENNQTISRGEIDDSIPWKSVPVHTIPEDQDNMLRQTEVICPAYYKMFLENIDTYPGKKERDAFSRLMSKHTGMVFENFFSYRAIYDTLVVEAQHNMTLPSWANDLLKSEMAQKVFDSLYPYWTSTPEMKRLRAGPLLQRLIGNIKKNDTTFLSVFHKSSKGQRKMYLFSGHDATIYSALHGLGIQDGLRAEYCSAFILELHEDEKNNRFVEVYYRNGTGSDPFRVTIPICGHPCSLQKFEEIIDPFIPLDWHKECQVLRNTNTISSGWVIAICLFGCVVIFILLKWLQRCWIEKKNRSSYDQLRM